MEIFKNLGTNHIERLSIDISEIFDPFNPYINGKTQTLYCFLLYSRPFTHHRKIIDTRLKSYIVS